MPKHRHDSLANIATLERTGRPRNDEAVHSGVIVCRHRHDSLATKRPMRLPSPTRRRHVATAEG